MDVALSSFGGFSMITKNELLSGLGKFKRGLEDELTMPAYTAGYGLSLADNEFSVTLQGGSNTTFDDGVVDNINKFFKPRVELQDRYARAPFDEANICNLDLSHLIDGENFELDTENLTDGEVTRIRSGSASYHVNNGISRGYVEVKTLCKCTVTVVYSISSQSSYDYGGCIVTEDAPNTEFTLADLKSSTVNKFFYKAGSYANQTATYTLAKNKTYYLNFGYAKNATTDSNDDRFYIHSITVTPELYADSEAECFFLATSDVADCIVSGIGGKFLPTVSSMAEILENGANFQYMTNKYRQLLNAPQPTISTAVTETFLGGTTTLSFAGNGSTTHSVYSSLFNGYVSLTSDTSTTTYTYKIAKLTETAGFLTQEAYLTSTNTRGVRNVIPFNVAATGKVSLGANTSIQAAAASGCESDWHMIPAIYDPHHILFLTWTNDASYNSAYKYTTVWFNGLTGAPTRTKALTNIGTNYFELANKTAIWAKGTSCGLLVRQDTYNSSPQKTKDSRYLLLHHGINKAVPVQYTYYTEANGTYTLNKPPYSYQKFHLVLNKSRQICYLIVRDNLSSNLTPAQIDIALKVLQINFATPEIYETNLKVSDIINDIF